MRKILLLASIIVSLTILSGMVFASYNSWTFGSVHLSPLINQDNAKPVGYYNPSQGPLKVEVTAKDEFSGIGRYVKITSAGAGQFNVGMAISKGACSDKSRKIVYTEKKSRSTLGEEKITFTVDFNKEGITEPGKYCIIFDDWNSIAQNTYGSSPLSFLSGKGTPVEIVVSKEFYAATTTNKGAYCGNDKAKVSRYCKYPSYEAYKQGAKFADAPLKVSACIDIVTNYDFGVCNDVTVGAPKILDTKIIEGLTKDQMTTILMGYQAAMGKPISLVNAQVAVDYLKKSGAVVLYAKTDVPSVAQVVWSRSAITNPLAPESSFEGSSLSAAPSTDHLLLILPSQKSAAYHYVVRAAVPTPSITNWKGDSETIPPIPTATSDMLLTAATTFVEDDKTPPKISNVNAVPTKFGATITFGTDELAKIKYVKWAGLEGDLLSADRSRTLYPASKELSLSTTHEVEVETGISQFIGHMDGYHYKIVVADKNNNEAEYDGAFQTLPDDAEPKMFQSVSVPAATTDSNGELKFGQIWWDDVSLRSASLFLCHGTVGQCNAPSATFKTYDHAFPDKVAADENGVEWFNEWNLGTLKSLGIAEGEEIVWYMKVCDKAGEFGAGTDNCVLTGKLNSIVTDRTPPTFDAEFIGIDLSHPKLSVGDTITIKLKKIEDKSGIFGLRSEYGVLGQEGATQIESRSLEGATSWEISQFDFTIPKSLEGKNAFFRVIAEDGKGNAGFYEYDIHVTDSTPPRVFADGNATSVMARSKAVITAKATDNQELSRLEFLVNGLVQNTVNATGTEFTQVFEIPLTDSQIGKNVNFKVIATDHEGLKGEYAGYVTVLPPPCADNTVPTLLSGPTQSKESALPGEKLTFSARFNDNVAVGGCGGLYKAELYTAGEDQKFWFAGFAFFSDSPDKVTNLNKITAGTISFNYTVPDLSKQITLTGLLLPIRTSSMLGPGGGGAGGPMLPGVGIRGLTGYAVAKQNNLGVFDILREMLTVTGFQSLPSQTSSTIGRESNTPPIPAPIGTSGKPIYWKIIAYDDANNKVETQPKMISVLDVEKPVSAGEVGFWRMPTEEPVTIKQGEFYTFDIGGKIVDFIVKGVAKDRYGSISSLTVSTVDKTYSLVQNEVIKFGNEGVMLKSFSVDEDGIAVAVFQKLSVLERIPQAEKFIVTSCWKDYGQLKSVTLEPIGVSVDLGKSAGNRECPLITVTPTLAPGATANLRLAVSDLSNNVAYSDVTSFVVNSAPPQLVDKKWTPQNPLRGQAVDFAISVKDDVGLSSVRLETDESGSFSTVASTSLMGTEATTNLRWRNRELFAGKVVNWRIIAVDTDGNEVEIDPSFTVLEDTTAPTYSGVKGVTEVKAGDTAVLSATFDDAGLAVIYLETDENGYWAVKDNKMVESTPVEVTFQWSNSGLPEGTVVHWRMKAVDTSANQVTTTEQSFTVAAADIIAAPAKSCDPSTKPADKNSACVGGQMEVTKYLCDGNTGLWGGVTSYQECAAPSVDYTLIIILVIIAAAAAGGLVLFKKGMLMKKAVAPSQPAPQ